jgi:CRP-like cAMP-binding protein
MEPTCQLKKEKVMVNTEEIKSIVLLTHLKAEMLEKVAELASVTSVKSQEFVFKEGDYAENLYAVLEGKVALEVEKEDKAPVRLKDIVQNRTFGISSLVDWGEKTCISHARAIADSKLVFWRAADLDKLFHHESELGFIFMKRITTILKDRLQIKNAQLASYNQ